MVVALIILSIAIFIIYRAKKLVGKDGVTTADPLLKKLSIIVFAATILQILLGTQVREEVDVLLKNFDAIYRNEIITNLGVYFKIHRSFSIIITLVNAWIIFRIRKTNGALSLKNSAKWLGLVVLTALVSGITLSMCALPAPVQPIHLLLACFIYGLQWMLILRIWEKQQ